MGLKEYLIIGFLIILIIVIVFVIINYLKHNDNYLAKKLLKRNSKYHNLVEITYSNSGNSNGNTNFLTIDLINNTMRTEYADYHNEPLSICEYKLDKNIHNIVDKIKEYNLQSYRNLPIDTNNIILDAPIKTLILVYKEEQIEYITIDFNMVMPTKSRERLNEVLKDIINLKNTSKIVRKYKKKR